MELNVGLVISHASQDCGVKLASFYVLLNSPFYKEKASFWENLKIVGNITK